MSAPYSLTGIPLATALALVADWFDQVDTAQAIGREPPPMPFIADTAMVRCRVAADLVATLDGMPTPSAPARPQPERTPHD